MRLYAAMPKKPHSIKLKMEGNPATLGATIGWSVQVLDEESQPINANFPIRVWQTANDRRQVLDEIYTTTLGNEGARGEFTKPKLPNGTNLNVSVAELLTSSRAMETGAALQPELARNTPMPSEYRFGPHMKDLVVSADGKRALATEMNGHENLFGFDVETGNGGWHQRIGDHISLTPMRAGNGFAVQTFDRRTAEGYHLSLINSAGEAERRFALFGLPKRANSWSNASHIADRGINSFAVSPDASWVASAGDLGLAVWSRDGSPRWSDDSWKSSRQRRQLLAVDASTLVAASGGTVTANNAMTGSKLWSLDVVSAGQITAARVSGDGKTLVVKADTDGGRVVVIRDQKAIGTIFGAADVALPTHDGRFIAVTQERRLKWFSDSGEMLWQFTGDEFLRNPDISADGEQVVASSELGTLTLLSSRGEMLAERDMRVDVCQVFVRRRSARRNVGR